MINFFRIITSVIMIIGLFFTFSSADENSRILRLSGNLEFEEVNVGENLSKELTLYNDGDSNLTIYSLRFHNKLEGRFSGNFSGVIEPGNSQSVTITFSPTEGKSYRGLVYVDSDRTNTNDRSILLKGTGVEVLENTRILSIGGQINFGDINVGETKTEELLISNNGNSVLTIYGLRYHEKIAGIFSGNFSGEIPVGGSKSVTITFTPKETETETKRYSGLVYVLSNRTNDGDKSVSLVGTGLVIAPPLCKRILTFDNNLDFGNVAIGDSSTKTLALHNEGTCDLNISKLRFHEKLEGTYTGNFSGIITAGGTEMVNVTFAPTVEKSYRGLVYIKSDKTNAGDRSSLLTGIGVLPEDECSGELANRVLTFGASPNFGTVPLNTTVSRDLILNNEGNCNLTISRLRFHEKLDGAYTGNFSGIISAGSSRAVSIHFTPTEEKSYNGLVYIKSDKTNSGDRSKLLIGQGTN